MMAPARAQDTYTFDWRAIGDRQACDRGRGPAFDDDASAHGHEHAHADPGPDARRQIRARFQRTGIAPVAGSCRGDSRTRSIPTLHILRRCHRGCHRRFRRAGCGGRFAVSSMDRYRRHLRSSLSEEFAAPPRARRVWRGQQLGGEVHRYRSLGAAADAMIGHGREILAFAVLALMTSPVAAAAQSTLTAGGLTSLTGIYALGPDLAQNGGFETNNGVKPAGWTTDSAWVVDGNTRRSGAWSVRLTDAPSVPFAQIARQTLTLRRGVYKLSGWIKTPGPRYEHIRQRRRSESRLQRERDPDARATRWWAAPGNGRISNRPTSSSRTTGQPP